MIEPLKKMTVIKVNRREYTILDVIGRGSTCIVYTALMDVGGLKQRCIVKEYAPKEEESRSCLDPVGMERFVNQLRLVHGLSVDGVCANEASTLLDLFMYEKTWYAVMAYTDGCVLADVSGLSFVSLVRIMKSIAKTMSVYHEHGYLFMDLKLENIFVLFDAKHEVVCDLVEFIDCDAMLAMDALDSSVMRVTYEYCAPEMKQCSKKAHVGVASDVYTLSECLFVSLFGRHSKDQEHRSFSNYPFVEGVLKYPLLERLDLQNVLVKFFRSTLRSSSSNRLQSMDEVLGYLSELERLALQEMYVVSKVSSKNTRLVGRKDDYDAFCALLELHKVVFVYGVGGIGKTSLVKAYCKKNAMAYENVVWMEFHQSFVDSFVDDSNVLIHPLKQEDGESKSAYYVRKRNCFKQLASKQRTLVVIDDFEGLVDEEMAAFLDGTFDVVVITRRIPSDVYARFEVKALKMVDAYSLFARNLNRSILVQEEVFVKQILEEVKCHTLLVVLLARQIQYSQLRVKQVYEFVRESGYSDQFLEKVDVSLEHKEAYASMVELLLELFDFVKLSDTKRAILMVLACFKYEVSLRDLKKVMGLLSFDDCNALIREGWIIEGNGMVSLHPVVLEAVYQSSCDVFIQDTLKEVCLSLSKMEDAYLLKQEMQLLKYVEGHGCVFGSEYVCLLTHCLKHVPLVEEAFLLEKSEVVLKRGIPCFDAMVIYDRLLYIALDRHDLKRAMEILNAEKELVSRKKDAKVLAMYYENMANYYDAKLNGNYDVQGIYERLDLKHLVKYQDKEIKQLRLLDMDVCNENLVRALLSRMLIACRSNETLAYDAYFAMVDCELEKSDVSYKMWNDYFVTKAFVLLLGNDDVEEMLECIEKAISLYEERVIDQDYIDFHIIPIANLYLEAWMVEESILYLQKGIDAILPMQEIEPYRRKLERLQSYMEDLKEYDC